MEIDAGAALMEEGADESLSWEERHKPTSLEQMALHPEHRALFEGYLKNGLSNHLIIHGPSGSGKTTVVNILQRALYPRGIAVLAVTSTQSGSVDFVRTTVFNYMRSMLAPKKLIVFEEASGLTDEAMDALKVPLEKFTDCRVIFITNKFEEVDEALVSRCQVLNMTRPPITECARVLGNVIKAEREEIPSGDVLAFTREHFSNVTNADLRTLLRSSQRAVETTGALPTGTVSSETERAFAVDEVWSSGVMAGDVPEGAKLLNDLADQFDKYLSLPQGGKEALALWSVFVWAHEAFSISPILTLVSPTMRAGKTTVFEMLEQLLIPETYHPSNITQAILFRLRGLADDEQNFPPTEPERPRLCLLIDEFDMSRMTELQKVLNSGWKRRGAIVMRMWKGEAGKFSAWYPKALAMIERPSGPLPDTLRDRSIVVPMQRMKSDEKKEKFPTHQIVAELTTLSEQISAWTRANYTALRALSGGALLSDENLNQRAQQNWHPLMCIARLAGGDWEEAARRVSRRLDEKTAERELLVDLLEGIRQVFEAEEAERIGSVRLVEKLNALEGAPWKDLGLNTTKLSAMLRGLKIRPQQLWTTSEGIGGRKKNVQGYDLAQFADAFSRYP